MMARRAATIPPVRVALRQVARLTLPLVALLLAAAVTPRPVLGDGDPASDILLVQNVFYPYAPPTGGRIQSRLDAETAAAHRAGFPIKVALIATPTDLGTVGSLFGKPQQYADYLDIELSFQHRQPLLVVMADGYGLKGIPARVARALADAAPPAGRSSDALAQAAGAAVVRLSTAAGHPIPTLRPTAPVPRDAAGSNLVALAIVAAAAVATTLVLLRLRARRLMRARRARARSRRPVPRDAPRAPGRRRVPPGDARPRRRR